MTFIDEHAALRETRAEDTSAFLAAQLAQSRDRLKDVEERLRKIKEAYMGRLPEQTQATCRWSRGLRQQQANTTMSLRSEQDRLAMIERQIEAMKGIGARKVARRSSGASTAAGSHRRAPPELDDASSMYTEKHPEVQRLKSELAAAEALAAAEQTCARGQRARRRSAPIRHIASSSPNATPPACASAITSAPSRAPKARSPSISGRVERRR